MDCRTATRRRAHSGPRLRAGLLHPPAGGARLLLYGRGFFAGVDRRARQQAQAAGLDIAYHQQDVREYAPETQFDFIMMTFGELNVFSAAEARSLVHRCAQWLVPWGKLLIEVHTYAEVKRQGMADPGWQRCPQGLFLDVPYLLLTEHAWDPAAQTSSTRFMAIEESGKVTRFGSRMTAWHDDAYLDLLRTAGLTTITRPDEVEWPVSETFTGKLYALLAEKTFPILFPQNP